MWVKLRPVKLQELAQKINIRVDLLLRLEDIQRHDQ